MPGVSSFPLKPSRPPRWTLRKKTLLFIGLTLVGLIASLYAVSRVVLLRSYAALEDQDTRKNLDRAVSALMDDLSTLDQEGTDYSDWDQTYTFMHGGYPNYPKSEFPIEGFLRLRVTGVLLVDTSGRQIFSQAVDLRKRAVVPFPAGFLPHIAPGSFLISLNDPQKKNEGILLLPEGPLLVVAQPIVTSQGKGPVAGTLVMTRTLNDDEVAHLAQLTHLSLSVRRFDDPGMPEDFLRARGAMNQGATSIQPLDTNTIAGYQRLDDVYGKPALLLRMELPRGIYQQGQASLLHFLILLLAAGLVFAAVALLVLERTVLSRLFTLTKGVAEIGASGDLSARVALTGRDELSSLGDTINRMLAGLESAQGKLERLRHQNEMILNSAGEGLYGVDLEGRATFVNPAAAAMLGWTVEDIVGQSMHTLIHHSRSDWTPYPGENCPIDASLRDGTARHADNEVFWKKDGTSFPVEYMSTPIRDDHGKQLGAVVVFKDISERVLLDEQLRRAQKMEAVGRLAGGVAHDFNNLLMVIKGHSDNLLDQLPQNDPLRHSVEQIHKAGDRAAALTRQLLAFSRMQVMQAKVLDLNTVVSDLSKMLPRILGEGVEFVFKANPKLRHVKADPGQLEQVILNLAVNSRDAMPRGGKLTIETSNVDLTTEYVRLHPAARPGRYVLLAVSDTGHGMDAETQARIFEPFFTTKERGKGTGLGLATAYGVVKQSDGFIWVYSEPGMGATFKVYLPMVDAPLDSPHGEWLTAPPVERRGSETILLAEDEEDVRELAREFLTKTGYVVLQARNGAEALNIAAQHPGPIHLLLTDVVMPTMGGPELADRLAPTRPGIRVLFMSGYAEYAAVKHEIIDRGSAALQKPFALEALGRKVREVLDGAAENALPSERIK